MTNTGYALTRTDSIVYAKGILNTDTIVPEVITPTEKVSNGGFETGWSMVDYADNWWVMTSSGSPHDSSLISKSSDSHGGTYAWALSSTAGGVSNLYENDIDGTAEQTMQIKVWAKTANSGQLGVMYWYSDGVDDYYWDFNSSTWDVAGGGVPGADHVQTLSPTESYTELTATQVTVPAGATEARAQIYVIGVSKTVIVDDYEFLDNGVNQAVNGTFEAWTQIANQTSSPTEWTVVQGADPMMDGQPSLADMESSYINRSSTAQAGSYALEFFNGSLVTGSTKRWYAYQTFAGTVGELVDNSVYTKSTNSGTGYMSFLNGNPGVHTQIWNFDTNSWDTVSTTVTDLPGTNNALTLSGTGSYVVNTENNVTVPSSGHYCVVLISNDGNGSNKSFLFDTSSAIEDVVTPKVPIVMQDSPNPSDSAYLDATDYIFKYRMTGGSTATVFALKGDGAIESSFLSIDFSGETVEVAEPSAATHPVSKNHFDLYRDNPLSTVSSINLKSTGQTTLYTVPVGKKLLVDRIIIEVTAADTVTVQPTLRVGKAASYDEFFDNLLMVGLEAVGDYSIVNGSITASQHSHTLFSAGEVVKLDVTTEATATTLTATVHLFGALLNA